MSLPLYAILAIIACAGFILWPYRKTIANAGQDIGMECEPLPFALGVSVEIVIGGGK